LDWNTANLWWLAAGVLVAAELATGTFYLLMVGLGCAAGALAAHAALGFTAQMLTAAVVGAGATTAWHLKRLRSPAPAPAESNRDVNLDIGQRLQVAHWAADGSARVHYRGASWAVRYAGSGTPQAGEHVIVALNGSELRVAPVAPLAAP
jgi:membrane protein implicated in regulation of membrane protease activity